jgi:glycosyltransferase involved in cell wall biosynthesis
MNHTIIKKKHILHLPKWYPHPADIQNGVFIKKHIEVASQKYNCSVVFVSSAKQIQCYLVETRAEEGTFTILVFFKEYAHQNALKPLIHTLRYLSALCKGVSLARKQFGDPAMVHAHVLLRTALIGWIFALFHHIPFVISEHWSGFINRNFLMKNFLYRKLAVFVLKRSERIIVVSGILKKNLVKLGINNSKIYIIPNIVDSLQPVEHREIIHANNKVIFVSVADLIDRIKNISTVIGIVAEIGNCCEIEYWIVGDGEDKEELVGLAESLGVLDKQVFFLGRKSNEEVLQILNKVDFLVMNSFTETFSVVTAEALLAGKPVIATRCGGPETFVNENNGILIEPGNPEALKSAIIEMIRNYQDYNPEILKSTITEKYSREAVREKILAVYDELIV